MTNIMINTTENRQSQIKLHAQGGPLWRPLPHIAAGLTYDKARTPAKRNAGCAHKERQS